MHTLKFLVLYYGHWFIKTGNGPRLNFCPTMSEWLHPNPAPFENWSLMFKTNPSPVQQQTASPFSSLRFLPEQKLSHLVIQSHEVHGVTRYPLLLKAKCPSVVSSVSGLKLNATWNSSQAYMINIEFESIYVFILGLLMWLVLFVRLTGSKRY